VTETEAVIGYSDVNHEPWMQDGRFDLTLIIAPAYRQQSYGQQLYAHALQWAEAHQATRLDTEVQEQFATGLAFAQKRGFVIDHHMFKSRIDLATFDGTAYDSLLSGLKTEGFRFFSLAEAGDTLEARRNLYELNKACALDDPSSTGVFIDFENFNRNFDTASWFRAEGQLLASVMEGNEERYVGLSAVGYFASDNYMDNLFTGVDRAYRGHKLAQALKSLSIRFAQSYGADYIITHNDSQNAPMLAVNRKLGYQPLPGVYRMVKQL
jgi:GNAT superfamily N-acetyltransferase